MSLRKHPTGLNYENKKKSSDDKFFPSKYVCIEWRQIR